MQLDDAQKMLLLQKAADIAIAIQATGAGGGYNPEGIKSLIDQFYEKLIALAKET